MCHVFSHLGLPVAIHSDNEPNLVSAGLDEAFEKLGVRRSSVAVRHPQGNSPAERFMRYLNSSLAIMLPAYNAWPQTLPLILFAYRVLPQETTGFSPFFLMYGRDPLLPLMASTLPPGEIHLVERDSKGEETPNSYITRLVQTMTDVFELVRKRQDRASRINAERRDENQNRHPVTFNVGDLVLMYDEDSAAGKLSDQRSKPPPKGTVVPAKWCMKQTGPHEVISDTVYNQCYIMNAVQQKRQRVSVDSLNLYHPFLPFPWASIPQVARRRGRPRKLHPVEAKTTPPEALPRPERVLKGYDKIQELQAGDICLVEQPLNAYEPVAPLMFIRHLDGDRVEMQWMGVFKLRWYINIRLRQQPWQLGWFQPNTRQFYWRSRSLTPKYHPPFTNLLSETTIYKRQIFLFGFKLRPDLRLPREVADIALSKYQNMTIPLEAEGERTFELDFTKKTDPERL
jgi:hypothetical protein